MPHEGYADPVMNDGPRFHLDIPISELTKCDTRAIEASVVSSIPLVVETMDVAMHKTWLTPTKHNGAWGLKLPNPDSGIGETEV